MLIYSYLFYSSTSSLHKQGRFGSIMLRTNSPKLKAIICMNSYIEDLLRIERRNRLDIKICLKENVRRNSTYLCQLWPENPYRERTTAQPCHSIMHTQLSCRLNPTLAMKARHVDDIVLLLFLEALQSSLMLRSPNGQNL